MVLSCVRVLDGVATQFPAGAGISALYPQSDGVIDSADGMAQEVRRGREPAVYHTSHLRLLIFIAFGLATALSLQMTAHLQLGQSPTISIHRGSQSASGAAAVSPLQNGVELPSGVAVLKPPRPTSFNGRLIGWTASGQVSAANAPKALADFTNLLRRAGWSGRQATSTDAFAVRQQASEWQLVKAVVGCQPDAVE
jgi:hypothetical protein